MTHLYSASGTSHVNEGSHNYARHAHVYLQVDWVVPLSPPQPQSVTAFCLVPISHAAEGRRLSWSGWLGEILRWFARPKTGHPSRY